MAAVKTPDLPAETVQKTIEQLWLSSLSSHDRITLIRTSHVSKDWATLFEKIQGNYATCRSITLHGHRAVLLLPSTYTELHMAYAINELLHHLLQLVPNFSTTKDYFQLEIYRSSYLKH